MIKVRISATWNGGSHSEVVDFDEEMTDEELEEYANERSAEWAGSGGGFERL